MSQSSVGAPQLVRGERELGPCSDARYRAKTQAVRVTRSVRVCRPVPQLRGTREVKSAECARLSTR